MKIGNCINTLLATRFWKADSYHRHVTDKLVAEIFIGMYQLSSIAETIITIQLD